ncbi:MAG: bifunctional folylpolyglutamate synthase/dihydrofolate synthase [Oscillospiraceae bacterium]
MEYAEALAWVHSRPRLPKKAGLDRMKQLMDALGNPQRMLRFIHVAGTNGKGSTVAMLSSVLTQAGYCVGSNYSPFVLDFRERFQVNGNWVDEAVLAKAFTQIHLASQTLAEPVVEFEVVTAAAFLCFYWADCDIVCLETGLGGRWDSTNIIENTLVACITRIGYDHMDLLGNTIGEIAMTKCGIIKQGCAVVSYPTQPKEAEEVILWECTKLQTPLVIPNIQDVQQTQPKAFLNTFRYKGEEFALSLLGSHQQQNATVAIEALFLLRQKGFCISMQDIKAGLKETHFPARFEVLRHSPPVILDGAHNQDSAEALAQTLEEQGVKGIAAIAGVLGDKQAAEVIRLVSPYIHILYTVQPDSPRALTAEALKETAAPFVKSIVSCSDVRQALHQAEEEGKGILIFGSLYLASEVRPLLLEKYKPE